MMLRFMLQILRIKSSYSITIRVILAFAVVASLISSCSSPCRTLEREDGPKPYRWNLELITPISNECGGNQIQSIPTDVEPVFVPDPPNRWFSCEELENLTWDNLCDKGKWLILGPICNDGSETYYEIPSGNVKKVTTTSNTLSPPTDYICNPCINCKRVRSGLWFFDKLELRGMVGYRGDVPSIFYPDIAGGTLYEAKNPLNFDRNGSWMVIGAEIGGLWSVEKSGAFQIGFLTGIWPIEESLFFPIALRLRYTFNQNPNPFGKTCNTPYVFADVGIPVDTKSKAPIFGDRYFWDIGAGYDIAISCSLDFSIDIGIRQMNLPLPPIECCPDIPEEDRIPFRKSTVGFLRFGLTF